MKSARRIGFFPRCGSNEGDVSLERENIFPLPAGSEKRGNFPRFYPRPPRIFAFLYPVCISNRRAIEIQIFFHVILKRFLFKSCTKSEYVVKLSSQAKIRERIRNKKNNRFLSFLLGAGISGIRESKDLCHEIGDDKRGKFRPL